jgi:hypothetical protein
MGEVLGVYTPGGEAVRAWKENGRGRLLFLPAVVFKPDKRL